MSSIINYKDRTTCPLFGDGAAAVLIEPNSEDFGVYDYINRVDGLGRHHLHIKAGGSLKPASLETVNNEEHYLYQEGQAVFKAAVSSMADVAVEIMEKNNITSNDIAWLVPHQANVITSYSIHYTKLYDPGVDAAFQILNLLESGGRQQLQRARRA